MAKKTDLIGYCGMYCGDCVGQTQTVANLAKALRGELRRYKFQDTAKDFAKIPMFKEFKDYEKCYNLLGTMMKLRCNKTCRGGGGPPDCMIRSCCRRKKIKGCWQCEDFPNCKTLSFLEAHHGTAHLKDLRKIKRAGPAAFIKGKRYWFN
jgi:hypothetical protein